MTKSPEFEAECSPDVGVGDSAADQVLREPVQVGEARGMCGACPDSEGDARIWMLPVSIPASIGREHIRVETDLRTEDLIFVLAAERVLESTNAFD
jgi:hypothetical protein